MALPLLQYNPSSQNHRVSSFGVADQNEDTPYIYRTEDVSSYTDMSSIIWAAYR
ncbi:MAG: phycobilisome rod-core linker polypeptide CpcG2, partial [Dolichospermum sp.]|nr:phycobilisome rod-core linker polypeptide CpcG2 [Dolichospermum sp.]